MSSNNIKVKAVKGRIARMSPRGEFIPEDRYVRVPLTPYIKRLRDHFGDIVEEPAKVAPAPAPKADAKAPAKEEK